MTPRGRRAVSVVRHLPGACAARPTYLTHAPRLPATATTLPLRAPHLHALYRATWAPPHCLSPCIVMDFSHRRASRMVDLMARSQTWRRTTPAGRWRTQSAYRPHTHTPPTCLARLPHPPHHHTACHPHPYPILPTTAYRDRRATWVPAWGHGPSKGNDNTGLASSPSRGDLDSFCSSHPHAVCSAHRTMPPHAHAALPRTTPSMLLLDVGNTGLSSAAPAARWPCFSGADRVSAPGDGPQTVGRQRKHHTRRPHAPFTDSSGTPQPTVRRAAHHTTTLTPIVAKWRQNTHT